MLRVLLLIDDYNELLYLQTILKKIGFDVEGLNSQKKYSDASLGFNPQILVASAKAKKVDALALGQTIRRHRGFPKIIALKRSNVSVTRDEMESSGLDLCVDSPVNIKKLVLAITELGDIDEAGFLAKLEKLSSSGEEVTAADIESIKPLDGLDSEISDLKTQKDVASIIGSDSDVQIVKGKVEKEEVQHVKGGAFPEETAEQYQVSEEDLQIRNKRFENYLGTMEKPGPGQYQRDRILEFNKTIREKGAAEDIEEVEDERKRFVDALFKKNDES